MMIIAISLSILFISMIVYSLCRIPSRAWGDVYRKSLRFDNRAAAGPFEDLLANGDVESVRRILKALEQRGDIDVFETEKEIYVSGHRSVSEDKRRKITRGLLVSDYDPVEDFRNLSVMSLLNRGARIVNADTDLCVSKYEAVSTTHHEATQDDLFSSSYDFIELLENLTIRPCLTATAQSPS
jgi:hypothetical protein